MHRHGYKGRKFGRERDQRRALIKGLADSLIRDESIKTTLPKAKELVPYVEKLITKAKKGDLHNRRQIIAKVSTIDSAHKLVDEIAPKLTGRNSGHLRIEKLANRRGDNAAMAQIVFVDDIKQAESKQEAPAKADSSKASKSVTKPTAKDTSKSAKTAKPTKTAKPAAKKVTAAKESK